MTFFKQLISFCFLIITSIALAQNSNAFLDRNYWKTNPSIQDVEQKIAEGHDVSELNQRAFDAVSWAFIEKTDNATIKHLLTKKGNDVNKLTHDGRTYIFWAAYRGNLEMMAYLVSKGAKTDIIDSHGYSLLNFAATTGQLNTALYDFCINNGSNIKTEKNHDGANALLLVAPHLKDAKLLDYFISKGLSINDVDNNGSGLFYYAVKKGNVELLKQLVALGVDHKSLNKNKENAMISASIGARRHVNTIEVFKYLESIDIKPNIVTTNGVTPLHSLAYTNKDLALFDYFISKGVDINQADEEGNTVFLNAAYNNKLETIKYFFKHIKDINIKNNKGQSALTNAIYRNEVSIVEFLIRNDADIAIKDNEGNNLMYYVLKQFNGNKQEEFNKKFQILKTNGLDIKEVQSKGNTLFHIALKKDDLELLKQIHKLGIDVNTKNNDGISALQIAAMKSKNDAILKYLLSIGADKTIKTDFNETVYDLAKENELLQAYNINFLK